MVAERNIWCIVRGALLAAQALAMLRCRVAVTRPEPQPVPYHRATIVAYGLACHIAFIGGVGAMMVVLFSGMTRALGAVAPPWSWLANALLLVQFPLLHTALLSRPGNRLVQRFAPKGLGAPLQMTTYALAASLQTGLLFLGWTPERHILWQAHGAALVGVSILYAGAWLLLLRAIVDAGFGLQTGLLGWWAAFRGRSPVYPPMPTRGLFRVVRQPIYVSFALTLWTVPTITVDGLIVAVALTGYCLIGPMFKEARFARRFGREFSAYRAHTPYWIPLLRKRGAPDQRAP